VIDSLNEALADVADMHDTCKTKLDAAQKELTELQKKAMQAKTHETQLRSDLQSTKDDFETLGQEKGGRIRELVREVLQEQGKGVDDIDEAMEKLDEDLKEKNLKGEEIDHLLGMFNGFSAKAHKKGECPVCKHKLDAEGALDSFDKQVAKNVKKLEKGKAERETGAGEVTLLKKIQAELLELKADWKVVKRQEEKVTELQDKLEEVGPGAQQAEEQLQRKQRTYAIAKTKWTNVGTLNQRAEHLGHYCNEIADMQRQIARKRQELEDEKSFMPGIGQGMSLDGEKEKEAQQNRQFAQTLEDMSEKQKENMLLQV
jgi:DNA repair exonuclease SbcCD ATPase subunit